jgi:protein involved in plasmid replication-relaxation
MSQLWWSQRRCQATWGALVQPHGFGRWQKRGAVLDFFLECDSAADARGRIATALAGYDELAAPTLSWPPPLRPKHHQRRREPWGASRDDQARAALNNLVVQQCHPAAMRAKSGKCANS